MSKKLYKVTCRGMDHSLTTGPSYGVAYVVAEQAGEAYEKVRANLVERKLGFSNERELKSVELIAESIAFPDCGTILYL